MDWSSEKYVRLYVRDTAEWLQVEPCARWFFYDLLRRVDMHGNIALGSSGLRALCALVHAPWSLIEPLLAELLKDGCIRLVGEGNKTALHIPNFDPAQGPPEAKRCGKGKRKHNGKHGKSASEARDGLVV